MELFTVYSLILVYNGLDLKANFPVRLGQTDIFFNFYSQ